MGRIGSSRTVEFCVALTLAILAVVGVLLCIGFLLIEPQLHPPGRTSGTTPIESLTQSCSPHIETVPLPQGCSYDDQQLLERAFCNLGTCDCATSNLEGSVCCCRATEESAIEGITCNGVQVPPIFVNATSCGCSVCDSIAITIRMTVVTSDDLDDTIPAAQVLRLVDGNPMLLGITDNAGRFTYKALAGEKNISFRIQAVGYMPKTIPFILLTPSIRFVDLTMTLLPLMNVELGLGGSALTLRLGRMAVVSAPGGAFHTSDGETYEDLVAFRGVVLDEDYTGLPSQNFEYEDDEGNMQAFGIIFATYLEFAGTDFEPLTSEQLKLDITLSGGLIEDGIPDMFLVALNETTGRWTKITDFKPKSGGLQKRQQSLDLQAAAIPLATFISVAFFLRIGCYVQIRTFGTGGAPDFPYYVRMEQQTASTGSTFRFGTETGRLQSTNENLQMNAICLPLACDDFTSIQLESRFSFADENSMSLVPVDFPPGVFDITEQAPLAIGTLFSIEQVITATQNRARPFYDNSDECAANGRETQTVRADWFEFNFLGVIDIPDPQDLCYIKINILDCFRSNTVSLTSIDSATSVSEDAVLTIVDEDFQQIPVTMSGTGPTEIPTSPGSCDASTATLRGACLSYTCTSIVRIIVAQSPDSDRTQLCDLIDLSVVLSSSLLTSASTDRQLIVQTQLLITDDYNDPNLALYHDPTMALASRERCFAGGTDMVSEIDINTGVAATFACFDPNAPNG